MKPSRAAGTPTSVLARLKNESDRTGEGFNSLLSRYASFRFLHRLSLSPYADQFFLKGATMFLVWAGSMHRPTRDIDLLALSPLAEEILRKVFQEVCAIECLEDAVVFDPASVHTDVIRQEQPHGGIRVKLTGHIGKARIALQVDVGFGDAVTPGPRRIELPAMIANVPAVRLKGYPAETAIAEKFQTLVVLGLGNSRMKDFVDIALLAAAMDFQGRTLAKAIRATFGTRGTPILAEIPVALTAEFWSDELVGDRFRAFVIKNAIGAPYDDLEFVAARIRDLVRPAMQAAHSGAALKESWRDGKWI